MMKGKKKNNKQLHLAKPTRKGIPFKSFFVFLRLSLIVVGDTKHIMVCIIIIRAILITTLINISLANRITSYYFINN